ncbi:MAG: hypothetical protein ABII00_10575 [Elusimicrobiota bacterium]
MPDNSDPERLLRVLESFDAKLAEMDLELQPEHDEAHAKLRTEIDKLTSEIDSLERTRHVPLVPRARLPGRPVLAGVAAALCVAGGVWIYRTASKPAPPQVEAPPAQAAVEPLEPLAETVSLPFPASAPTGLFVEHGSYASVDRESGLLVRLDPDSSRLFQTTPFPNPDAAGLSLGRACVWSTDPKSGMILLHHPKTSVVLEEFRSPGESPSAVHWDGKQLWSYDRRTRKVYRHAFDKSLSVITEAAVSEADPVGIHRDRDHLWVLDAASRSIGRYRIGDRLEPAGRAPIGPHLPEGGRLSGFSVNGAWAWIITQKPAALHRVDIRRIEFLPKKG